MYEKLFVFFCFCANAMVFTFKRSDFWFNFRYRFSFFTTLCCKKSRYPLINILYCTLENPEYRYKVFNTKSNFMWIILFVEAKNQHFHIQEITNEKILKFSELKSYFHALALRYYGHPWLLLLWFVVGGTIIWTLCNFCGLLLNITNPSSNLLRNHASYKEYCIDSNFFMDTQKPLHRLYPCRSHVPQPRHGSFPLHSRIVQVLKMFQP